MSELPNGWASTTSDEVCEYITSGSRDWKKYYSDDGAIFIRTQDINKDVLNLSNVAYVSLPEKVEGKRSLVEPGDLLVTITGANVGKAAIVPDGVPEAYVSQSVGLMRLTDKRIAKFLHYYLQGDEVGRKHVLNMVYGMGRPVLSLMNLREIPIPLAPLPEQRRIVARIEELFSRLDAGVAALRRAKTLLSRYRQSVLAAAVTGELTRGWREQNSDTEPAEELLERILEKRRVQWKGRGKYKEAASQDSLPFDVPSSWATANIDSVISAIEAGKNFKCDERPPKDGETGLVKISAVTWGKFDELESKTVTKVDQIRKEHLIRSGDFLLSRANTLELVGAPVIVDQIERQLMLSDKVLRFRFVERLEKLTLFWLRSKFGRSEIESRATGNQLSMRNISQANLRAIPLPLPPLAELHQIVAEVEARTTAIDHLEAELDSLIIRSARLRQSILCEAFNGNLVPQNPDDKSATSFLEAAKTKTPKKKFTPRKKLMKTSKPKDLRAEVIDAISKLSNDQFSFDELFATIKADYDQTKEIIFQLLGENQPEIKQEFDGNSKRVVLSRRSIK